MGGAIEVEGLRELRSAFRAAEGKTKDLSAAHRRVAQLAAERARAAAATGTRQQAAAARVIVGRGVASGADLAVRNTASVPFGKGAFFGALRWHQFPQWVGNSWSIESGTGPYVITGVLTNARNLDEFQDLFLEEFSAAFAAVGLDLET